MEINNFIKQFDFQTGPIEVQESGQICWNNIDWPIYMKCTFTEEIQKLIQIMLNGWKLTKPQIIITIISDFNPLDSWTIDGEIRSQLTNGLCKAVSSARMWILTNGIDVGASRLMSTIVNNLKCWENAINQQDPKESSFLDAADRTICIGVVREDRLTSDPIMQRHLKNIQNLNERKPIGSKQGKFFIDELHNHFIFLKSKKEELEIEQLFTLELMYQMSFETIWKEKEDSLGSYLMKHRYFHSSFLNRIPFVAILIQGDQSSSIVVNEYLIKQIPIVVLTGSGGFADLLHFAYNEIRQILPGDCSDELNDVQFLNKQFAFIFKSKILTFFPELHNRDEELNFLCENLVDCIRFSVQDGIEYLTFLSVNNEDHQQLAKLNEYLLSAFIKSTKVYELDNLLLRHSRINSEEDLLNENLKLTLDWNCPSIAKELIQRKLLKGSVKIDRTLFKRALVEKNREQFIGYFMEASFQTRQLLNLQTIEWFFQQALKKEFFLVVCCERILSLPITLIRFIPFQPYLLGKLNQLILRTANLHSFFDETSFNYQNQSSNCLENQMITFIIMWSVLTLNIEVIRQLWPFHSHPIPVLLIACNMLKNLNKFINDIAQNEQVNLYKQQLGDLATSLLDEAFTHARFRAIDTLTSKKLHFSNYLSCDVAANSLVFSFIEHQQTQKWLTDLFTNGIYVKQFSRFGFLDHLLPNGFKIFCCFMFLFPVNFWLHFSWLVEDTDGVKKETSMDGWFARQLERRAKLLLKDEDSNTARDEDMLGRRLNFGKLNNSSGSLERLTSLKEHGSDEPQWRRFPQKIGQSSRKIGRFGSLTLKKWMYLMNAPAAKFWSSLIFFLLFLFAFTYAVIYPSRGSKQLDLLIFVWYNCIVFEHIRITYLILKNYLSINVYHKCVELPFAFAFLVILYLGRIVDYPPIADQHQYFVKMLMCAVLLQNWVHFVFTYLPISPTLGPLFYYLKKMSTHDTFFFLILCTPVLIGCGLAIQVSLYPDKPFDAGVAKTIIYRTFLNLFLTLDDELKYTEACYKKLPEGFFAFGASPKQVTNPATDNRQCSYSFTGDKECPNIGIASYLFAFTFFLLLKLILLNILYAMFSSSLISYNKQTIWRFQRFNLIMYFNLTSPLPPPFNLLFYLYFLYGRSKTTLINAIHRCPKTAEINRNKYCPLCSDALNNHFWNRVASIVKQRASQSDVRLAGDAKPAGDARLAGEAKLTDDKRTAASAEQSDSLAASQRTKLNELNQNLNEIKKVLFQLDYTNVDLSEREVIGKLKWIIKS